MNESIRRFLRRVFVIRKRSNNDNNNNNSPRMIEKGKMRRFNGYLLVTDGALAKFATTVGKGSVDDGIHSEAQRDDRQSAREYLSWTPFLNFTSTISSPP